MIKMGKWSNREMAIKMNAFLLETVCIDTINALYPNPKAINITWLFVEYDLKGFMNLIINYVYRGGLLS